MKRSLGGLVALCIAVAAPSLGCSADTTDGLDAVDETSEEINAVTQLLGDYTGGTAGRFESLKLTQTTVDGRKVNGYQAGEIVQCVTWPCPTQTTAGRWFARSGTLTLHPDSRAPRQTFRFAIHNRTLRLTDANGVVVAEVYKQLPEPAGIRDILERRGVSFMDVDIDGNEVDAQGGAPGVDVPFNEAFDKAIELFLTSAELRSNVAEFEDEVQSQCHTTDRDAQVICLANELTSVSLMARDSDGPPDDGAVAEDWVLEFFVNNFTDHGYYAIVPKKRSAGAAYIYAFN